MKSFLVDLGQILILAIVLALVGVMISLSSDILRLNTMSDDQNVKQAKVCGSCGGGKIPYLEPAPVWELKPVSTTYTYMSSDASKGVLNIRLYPLPNTPPLEPKYRLATEYVIDVEYFIKEGVVRKDVVVVRNGLNKPTIVQLGNTRIPPIPSLNKISCIGPAWPEENVPTQDERELKNGDNFAYIKVADSKILQGIISQIQ